MAAQQEEMKQLARAELEAFWMPYTGNRQYKGDPRMIVRGEGAFYWDADGRKIFDGLSGLWCVPFGHGRQEIVAAVSAQIKELDYSPGFQFGHPSAFELANKVKELTPADLDYIFFCNSGSEAVDTAMKMVRGYWRLKGQSTKTRVIGRAKGYHGVNYGGTSVGGLGPNRKLFGQLPDVDHLRHTQLPENAFSRGLPDHGAEIADELEDIVALHDVSNIAAVIVEPFAGSGGVVVPPKGYLKRLRAICDKHDILLIFDEVITGFGRTGAPFGAHAFGVTPDLITMAKGLTNGTVPMGAVAAKTDIYETYMENGGPDYMLEFPHGYTYSAHPVACAAGIAAMDIFTKERMWERAAELAEHLEAVAHGLKGTQYVADIRNCGLAAGITIEAYPGEPARRPFEIAMKCWDKGLYVRYGGDCIAVAPPFICEKAQIDDAFNILGDAINALD